MIITIRQKIIDDQIIGILVAERSSDEIYQFTLKKMPWRDDLVIIEKIKQRQNVMRIGAIMMWPAHFTVPTNRASISSERITWLSCTFSMISAISYRSRMSPFRKWPWCFWKWRRCFRFHYHEAPFIIFYRWLVFSIIDFEFPQNRYVQCVC